MRIGSIDPGVNGCGVAFFSADRLVHAAYIPDSIGQRLWLRRNFDRGDLIVIEFPRIYPAARQRGDQNDLLQLARVVGGLEEVALDFGFQVELVIPRDWKGTLDPDDMIERIRGRLNIGEHAAVVMPSAESLQHNVYDAIGIGLHVVGRLTPRKVYPR